MFEDLFNYLWLILFIFVVNIIPISAPPTWLLLTLQNTHNPAQDILLLAFLGVVGSVAGRFVMYWYSRIFAKFIPKNYTRNINYLTKFIRKRHIGVMLGSFLFSLSPLPSNFMFISAGISRLKLLPIIAGFAGGRIISYYAIVYAAQQARIVIEPYLNIDIRIVIDVIGLLSVLALFFINWKNLYLKIKRGRKKA